MRRSLVLTLTLLLTACGSAQHAQTAPPRTTVSGATPSPRLTPPTAGPRTLVVREQDNGRAVSVHAGDRVQVLLTGTAWEVAASSDPNVLRPSGPPAVSPQATACPGGEDCGTVTTTFDAVGAGQALVTARRTSCPEAQSCGRNLGLYQVTVLVTG